MFEFEDMSTGFHDVFLSKYTDTSGPILDLYISDSMQDMLDIDIRSEVATVVGGTNEFSSLINDLPSLELDSNSNDGDVSWLGGPKWSATNHTDFYADVGACVNPNSVMPIITSSLLTSPKCQVNLNTNNYRQNLTSPPPSPKENKSHLTFSPNQIKLPSSMQHDILRKPSQLTLPNNSEQLEAVKKDLRNIVTSLNNGSNNNNNISSNERKSIMINNINNHHNNNNNNNRTMVSSNNHQIINSNSLLSGSNTIKLAPGIGGLTFANNFAYTKMKQQNLKQTPSTTTTGHSGMNGNNVIIKRERDTSSPLQNHNVNANYNTTGNNNNNIPQNNGNKNLSRNILIQNKNIIMNGINSSQVGNSVNSNGNNNNLSSNKNNNNNNKPKPTGQEFPKPAYSYSCLIAMALKNSRSGSLPVSEIYSFMCEHFPYFKTAPNGWKNSVRHNLSLNKCFEKIEKPATNGGQRKGCLWAMNPTKITKMDEEVQKWSRKDPMAIRKAMVYPEHLEALERGEMKHGSTGDSDNENDGQSDVEETSDLGEDNEIDETLVETQESVEEEEEEDDRDFEIEVQDIYDAIDLEDDKEALRLAIQQNDLIEYTEKGFSSPKRAKLDINYSIGPAGAFKQQQQQQQQSSHTKQEVNGAPHHHHHHSQLLQQHHQHTTHHSRRKMQLVNRIA